MDIVQDPRLKHAMKSAILQVMYGPYESRRHKEMISILERNCVLQRTTIPVFTFKGVTYGNPTVQRIVRPKLHPDLHERMMVLINEGNEVHMHERPYIDNYITLVLNSSPSAEDWLALLPETFQGPVRTLIVSYTTAPAQLSADEVALLIEKHQPAIQLMKQRMAINLIQT